MKTSRLLSAALAFSAALPLFSATTYYVDNATGDDNNGGTSPGAALKTIAKGVSKAVAGDVVEVAAGTYPITSQIAVSKAITIRGAGPASTIVDAAGKCRIFYVTAAATIESLKLYRGTGGTGQAGAGAHFTAGGTLRNCVIDYCTSPNGGGVPHGTALRLAGGATATGCVISRGRAAINGSVYGVGVYIEGNSTLSDSLVTGCVRSGNADKADTAAVYLAKGTVERCTITGNTLASSAGLYVANDSACIVRDTIVWGNVTTKSTAKLRPNMNDVGAKCVLENVCTSGRVGTGGVDANPCFRDAASGDYSLMPGSPCIGAGTGGRDIGYLQHDATADALGISVSAYRGRESLTATVTLSASGAYSLTGATVTWAGLEETGPTITHTFGPGTYSLTANVTFADSTTASVTLANAIRVTTGVAYIDDDSANPVPPYATPETAARTFAEAFAYLDDTNVVAYVAEGTYNFSSSSQIILLTRARVIATGRRDATILRKTESGARFFWLYGSGTEVSGFLMDGRTYMAPSSGGAICVSGSGIVSNCVVRGCKSSTNTDGGGLYMTAGVATHCIVTNCMGNTYACGAGVYLGAGAILRDSIVAGCGNSSKRTSTSNKGGGLYLTGAGTKAVNCTVVNNTSCLGGGVYVSGSEPVVANCIVFGNDEGGTSSTGSPDWVGTASCFVNCISKVAPNGTCKAISASPVAADYTLDPASGSDCINGGDNSYVATTADLFGNPRIVNGTVDIGAAEYASVDVVPGFQADVLRGLAPLRVVLSGTVQGLDPEGATFTWYLDGSDTPAGTGQTFTNFFGVGYHTVRAVVSKDGSDYATEWSAADYILALPTHMYVAVGAAPAFPYDTPETAAADIHAVMDLTREADGVTVTVGPGRYSLRKTIMIDRARTTLLGAGSDATVLYSPYPYSHGQAFKILDVNSRNGLVADLCLSNGVGQAGGVYIHGDGGHVTRCLITHCQGPTNQDGGGAYLEGANARLSRSVIRKCKGDTTNAGSMAVYGGGVSLHGGRVDDCLLVDNECEAGGGALVSGGTLANCVVTGNKAWNKSGARTFCAGGVYATGGTVLNCIVVGNSTDGGAVADTPVANAYGVSYFSHCLLPSLFAGQGSATVAADDPGFRDAANGDYRILASSPAYRKGLAQSWMTEALDFYGNPRRRGGHVDIGLHQSPSASTFMRVR